MNQTQKQEIADAHVVAYKNEQCYNSSKATIEAFKPQESAKKILEKLKRELWYFSQDNVVAISYVKVESGFENRHIYTVKVKAPINLELYNSNTPDWQQSGQNLEIPQRVLDEVQKITGGKQYGVKVHLGKLIANRYTKIDSEDVTLEVSFVKTVKTKHYTIRDDD